MPRHNRRDFFKRSAVVGVAAAFAISGTKASGNVLGANDRIRIALAGINTRGIVHMKMYSKVPGVELAYLVDTDSRLFEPRLKDLDELKMPPAKCEQDIRKVLDDKDVDVVSIATPNHWHSLLAIWACKAGKDVYCEKPCSHNIFEGRKLVEAARKYDRIVQHGTQSRSDRYFNDLVAAASSGKYGKLEICYGYASKPRGSLGIKPFKAPPEGFNFDIWLGPAPEQLYHENIVHYNWHWFWDFGNGEIGNQGVHQLDIARWAMPKGAAPKSVISLGGRFGYQDQGQTPNTQLTIFDFGDVKLFFEDRGLVAKQKICNEFYTDEGVIKPVVIGKDKDKKTIHQFFPKGKTEGVPIVSESEQNVELHPDHFANFIDCVRSRKCEDLNAEILEGHKSALLAHLANISYRVGKYDVPFRNKVEAFGDDQAAGEAFESMKEHLADAAQMKLDEATYKLGRRLTYDADAERFVGDEQANQFLSRAYREPFVVPEVV